MKKLSFLFALLLVAPALSQAATKDQLLNAIEAKAFVGAIAGEPQYVGEEADGGKKYKIIVREENGNIADYRALYYVVLNEGTPQERALVLREFVPKSTITDTV